MKCKYGNARCLCQNCKRNAAHEQRTNVYCFGCFECEKAGEAVHDVWACTGQEKIQEDEDE